MDSVSLPRPQPEVALLEQLAPLLEELRSLHDRALLAIHDLLQRVQNTANASLAEVGYHEIWHREVNQLLEDLSKRCSEVKDWNAKRAFTLAVPQGIESWDGWGKRFRVGADLVPGSPSLGSEPEKHAEMLSWFKAHPELSSLVREDIPYQSLKKACNELAERGLAGPPHVRLYPKPSLSVRKAGTKE